MSLIIRFLSLALVVSNVPAAWAQEKSRPPIGAITENYLITVRAATAQLGHEIQSLQETIVAEGADKKERGLYRKADLVLDEISNFQRALKAKVQREDLYKKFDQLDQSLHALVDEVRKPKKAQRALVRAVNYVQAADDYLHYVLSEGDVSEARTQQSLERQGRALVGAVLELENTANYALGDAPGRAVLLGDLSKFHKAVELFQKNLTGKGDRADLQKRFAPSKEAWNKVIAGMKLLPERENVYLLHSATRVDQLYDRIARLLGIEEKRPSLIIQT